MNERDTMRWVRRGCALAALVIGWVFIAWQNHFHITAPLVMVCLGYLAAVATIYNLWRTGAAVVASDEDEGDSTWAKPAGALGELEREKRTLIKAIKEAEFDHQMGKLSQRDADEMIRTYRARAIEVIKDIERLELGAAGSAREQILREVRARIELEAKANKKSGDAKQAGKANQGKGKARPLKDSATPPESSNAASPAADAADGTVADAAGTTTAAPGAAEEVGPDGGPDGAEGAAEHAAPDAPEDAAEVPAAARAAARALLDDEAMDADSTTAVEPKRDDAAKEATP